MIPGHLQIALELARLTPRAPWSRAFRARLVLMALRRYGFGDHVTDDRAYSMRLARWLRDRKPLVLAEDPREMRAFTDEDGNQYLIRPGSIFHTDGIV